MTMASDPRVLLEQLCDEAKLTRFSASEMVELLEDGEEVDWISEQVLDDPAADPAPRLRELLSTIQAEVAPPSADTADEAESEAEASGTAAEAGDAPPDLMPGGIDLAGANLSGLDLSGLELPPGVDASQLQQVMSSPRGALLSDFGAFCEERGFSQDAGAEPGAEEALRELHDEWLETPRPTLEGKRPSEMLDGGRLFPEKVETFRREAPKVGRNDPCPCGSGRKYKKCCGKAA